MKTLYSVNPKYKRMNEMLNEDSAEPLVKGRDIIVISLSHWDTTLGSNARNLSTRFAKHNRVLYVNYPITRKTYMLNEPGTETELHRNIIKEDSDKIKEVAPNCLYIILQRLLSRLKKIPFTPLFKIANYFNNRRYAKDIKKAIKQLGFKDYIIFNDNDIYNGFYLKELLKPSMYIYYFKDFLQAFKYWKQHAVTMEPQLIKKVDAIVANSTYYSEYCATLTPHSYFIGQGCDLRLFVKKENREVPEDIKHLSGPIIGYVGVVFSERLDEKILIHLADENPNWNIVLAGPEDDFFKASSLHERKNVHFLGFKSIDQVPDYLAAFDVCMNPQLINKITRGNYPLKIDEYLAMGKPVVATRTKAMKFFEDYSYLADKPEDYTPLIKKALAENTPEKAKARIAFANSHTWENCVKKVYEVIANHPSSR
ncbi:MAG: glycosyltransferase [Chitinophagaceae bacterium]